MAPVTLTYKVHAVHSGYRGGGRGNAAHFYTLEATLIHNNNSEHCVKAVLPTNETLARFSSEITIHGEGKCLRGVDDLIEVEISPVTE
jgi:hypothetical protein